MSALIFSRGVEGNSTDHGLEVEEMAKLEGEEDVITHVKFATAWLGDSV